MATIKRRGKSWQVRIRRNGFADETKSFGSKLEAERWQRGTVAAMDQGAFVSRALAEQTTLGETLTRYLNEVTPLHRGSEVEAIRIRKFMRHGLARLSLAAISAQRIAEYRDERLRAVTPGSVLRELQILSAIFNHARREWGLAIENPVTAIRRPAPNRARARRLEDGEEERLVAALELDARGYSGRYRGMRNPWVKPVVLFALETAMRRGEILSLTWDDVDQTRRVALLHLTKNGTARAVPLSTKALEVLRPLPRSSDGRVFPISANALKLSFCRAVTRAGIKGFHFHDLRHEATSRLSQKLPNLIELAAVTGHKDLRMLGRYYHPRAEDLARKLA